MLRLYAENDRLKIRELEDRTRIQKLLGLEHQPLVIPPFPVVKLLSMLLLEHAHVISLELTQPVEHEATYFRQPGDAPLVGKGGRTNGKDVHKAGDSKEKVARDNADEVHAQNQKLVLTVESLQAQLEDQTRLAQEQVRSVIVVRYQHRRHRHHQ